MEDRRRDALDDSKPDEAAREILGEVQALLNVFF